MKRFIVILFAVFVFLPALAVSAYCADVGISADFEDGFSDNSGKLAVTVTNSPGSAGADVALSLALPEGVSCPSPEAQFENIAPGDSVTKDFMLTFEAPSFFATHKALVAAAALFAVTLAAFVAVLVRRKKGKSVKSALVALALLPASLLCTNVLSASEKQLTVTASHGGREYEITVKAAVADSPEYDDMSTPAPAQTGESAISHEIKNTRKPDPNAEYNIPVVAESRIKEGAGPLGDMKIYVGKNDFMFYGEEIDYYAGRTSLGEKKIEKIAENLTQMKEKAAQTGADLYLLICPNKSTVYPDYVPEKVSAAEKTPRTQLVSYLKENTDVNVIDATDAMIAAREEYGDSLYYKYDAHWTQHGGYIAYRELIRAIRRDHGDTPFYASDYYDVNEYETYMKDNAYYLGYYAKYTDYGPVYSLKKGPEATLTAKRSEKPHGQYIFCLTWENGYRDDLTFVSFESVNTSAPKAYVLRDSFAIAMMPFLKESFASSSFLWDDHTTFDAIKQSGADVIIIEIVERTLEELTSARFS